MKSIYNHWSIKLDFIVKLVNFFCSQNACASQIDYPVEQMFYRTDPLNASDLLTISIFLHYFFSFLFQIKTGSTNRDASLLLSYYNGGKWVHETASSVCFNNERTNLGLAAITQTKHVIKLQQREDKIDSGLIPCFMWCLLAHLIFHNYVLLKKVMFLAFGIMKFAIFSFFTRSILWSFGF